MEPPADPVPPVSHERWEDDRHQVLDPRQREGAQHPAHLSAQAAAVDEHEALGQLGVLIGELHGDAAAQRLADDGCPLHLEGTEEVAQPAGKGAERVVAGGLGRLAVAQQVRGDDIVSAGQRGHDLAPGVRASGHAVNQQDGRPFAAAPVAARRGCGGSAVSAPWLRLLPALSIGRRSGFRTQAPRRSDERWDSVKRALRVSLVISASSRERESLSPPSAAASTPSQATFATTRVITCRM